MGDEVDSICTRCKGETIHRVVAMVEGKVHLVLCTRCNSQHRYRPSLEAIRRKVPLPSERQARVIKKMESAQGSFSSETRRTWQNLKERAKEREPLPYNPAVAYSENQAIVHPSFGLGFVYKVIDTSKMEVLFEHGVKTLVMNRRR